jgi:hypothetical protein
MAASIVPTQAIPVTTPDGIPGHDDVTAVNAIKSQEQQLKAEEFALNTFRLAFCTFGYSIRTLLTCTFVCNE